MKRLAIPSILIVLILSGCAVQRGMMAEGAKTKLIGMSKYDFMRCAGEPWEMRSYGSTETLHYVSENTESIHDKFRIPFKKAVEGEYCEAHVGITDGKVSSIRYSGQTGGLVTFTEGEACAAIVERCLASK
jgi:hypothetical protein